MRPSGVSVAFSSSSCGGPFGSQPSSSSRLHCTRTGVPTAFEQHHRFGRGIVVAVHAVAAGAVEVDDAQLVARQLDQRGEDVEEAVARLRRGPDRAAVGVHVGHGAGRADRAVRLDRPRVGGRELPRRHRRARRRVRVALGQDGLLGDERTLLRPLDERGVADQRRALAPAHRELARRPHRRPFVGGDDGDEIGDPQHAHAGQAGDRRLVDRLDPGADRGRPQHPAVQHARQHVVVDEDMPARDLGRQVGPRQRLADEHVLRRRLQRRLGIHLQVEAAGRRPARRGRGGDRPLPGPRRRPAPARPTAASAARRRSPAAPRAPSPRPGAAPPRRA